jgi:hypothetical protein
MGSTPIESDLDPNAPLIACAGCLKGWRDEEQFEQAGGSWCNLGACRNAPICDDCATAHYEAHE